MRFRDKEFEVSVKGPNGEVVTKRIPRRELYSSVHCGLRPAERVPGFEWESKELVLPDDDDGEITCPENEKGYCPLLEDVCPVLPLMMIELMTEDDNYREARRQQGNPFGAIYALATLSFLDFEPVEISTANLDITTLILKFFPSEVVAEFKESGMIAYATNWVDQDDRYFGPSRGIAYYSTTIGLRHVLIKIIRKLRFKFGV